MIKKPKIITIVGTRPELIKLSIIISELDKISNHFLIHTGQNFDYELNEIFYKDFSIRKPDIFFNSYAKSANESILIKSLKNAINKDSKYKNEAKIDLEFVNFRDNESFINLIK